MIARTILITVWLAVGFMLQPWPVDQDTAIDIVEAEPEDEFVEEEAVLEAVPEPVPEELPAPCWGRFCHTATDTLAALQTVGPRTNCVVRAEVGMNGGWRDERTGLIEPQWSPNMVNYATGVIGPGQLCCDSHYQREGRQLIGKLPQFLASRPNADPWSPYQVIPWIQDQILQGQGSHWAGILLKWC